MKQFNDLIEVSKLIETYATSKDKLELNLAYTKRIIPDKEKNKIIHIEVNIDSFNTPPEMYISDESLNEYNFIKFETNKNYSDYISNHYQLGHLKFEKYQHIKNDVDFIYNCSDEIKNQNQKVTSFISKYIEYINENIDVIFPNHIYYTKEKNVNEKIEVENYVDKNGKTKIKKIDQTKTYIIKNINQTDVEKNNKKNCIISFNFLQNNEYLNIFEIFKNNDHFSFDGFDFSISDLIKYLNDNLFNKKFHVENDNVYLKSSLLSMKTHELLNNRLSKNNTINDVVLSSNCENFDIKNQYKMSNLDINDYKYLLTAESLFFKLKKRLINDYHLLVIPEYYGLDKLTDDAKKIYYSNMINYINGITSKNIEDYDEDDEDVNDEENEVSVNFNDFDGIEIFEKVKNKISFNVYVYSYIAKNGIIIIEDCVNNLPYSFLLSRINEIKKQRKNYDIDDYYINDKKVTIKNTLESSIYNSMYIKNKSITPIKNTYFKIFFDELQNNVDLDNILINKCDNAIKKLNDKKEQSKLNSIIRNYYFLKSFEKKNQLFDESYLLGFYIGELINKISHLDDEYGKKNLITQIKSLLIDVKRVSYLSDVKEHLSTILEKYLKNNYNTDKIYLNNILKLIDINQFNNKNYIIGFYTGYNKHHLNIYSKPYTKGDKPIGNVFDISIEPQLPMLPMQLKNNNNTIGGLLSDYLIKCMSCIDRKILSLEYEQNLKNEKPIFLIKKNNLYHYIVQIFNSLYSLKTTDDIIEFIDTLYEKMEINKYLHKNIIENDSNRNFYYLPFFKKYTENIKNEIISCQNSTDFIYDFSTNFISKYRNLNK